MTSATRKNKKSNSSIKNGKLGFSSSSKTLRRKTMSQHSSAINSANKRIQMQYNDEFIVNKYNEEYKKINVFSDYKKIAYYNEKAYNLFSYLRKNKVEEATIKEIIEILDELHKEKKITQIKNKIKRILNIITEAFTVDNVLFAVVGPIAIPALIGYIISLAAFAGFIDSIHLITVYPLNVIYEKYKYGMETKTKTKKFPMYNYGFVEKKFFI